MTNIYIVQFSDDDVLLLDQKYRQAYIIPELALLDKNKNVFYKFFTTKFKKKVLH